MEFAIHDLLVCTNGLTTNATPNEIQGATTVMGQMLDKSSGSSFVLKMMIPESNGLDIEWQQLGIGTGTITWREDDAFAAFSIICSGIDPAADEKAVTDFIEWLDLKEEAIKQMRAMVAPFLSTLYNTPRSISHLKVCGLSIGFGQAFFDRLDRTAPPIRGNLRMPPEE